MSAPIVDYRHSLYFARSFTRWQSVGFAVTCGGRGIVELICTDYYCLFDGAWHIHGTMTTMMNDGGVMTVGMTLATTSTTYDDDYENEDHDSLACGVEAFGTCRMEG